MKPYYDDGTCVIYHGDCREVGVWRHASVLVTDPPYGIDFASNRVPGRAAAPIAGDGDVELRDDVLHAWGNQRPALVFGTWKMPMPARTRHVLIWDKGDDPGMGDLTMPWGSSFEEIYVLGEGFCGPRGPNVLRVPTVRGDARPDHPTPKPVGLMAMLLIKCPPGTIADPFMGSGTTLRAAKDLGRKAIGIEIEERYCEIAAKRLAQEVLDFGGANVTQNNDRVGLEYPCEPGDAA